MSAVVDTGAHAVERERIIIDALNVAYWGGRSADLRLPLALGCVLLDAGLVAELYFDASAPHRVGSARAAYEQLRQESPLVLQAPTGIRADGEILRRARKTGARIVSRDRFRDYRARFRRLIDDPQRVLDGHVEAGRVHLPALHLSAEVPPAPEIAVAGFVAAYRLAAATFERIAP